MRRGSLDVVEWASMRPLMKTLRADNDSVKNRRVLNHRICSNVGRGGSSCAGRFHRPTPRLPVADTHSGNRSTASHSSGLAESTSLR